MKGLTYKQKQFADAYIQYGNATKAEKEAGYSEKSAHQIGSENLRKLEVKKYIDASKC